MIAQRAEFFAGPLPHPDLLARYAEIIPDAPERLLTVFEHQAAHRMDSESFALRHEARRSDLGLVAAFIVAVVGLIVAGVVAIEASTIAGVAIAALDIGGLVGTFVYGTERRRTERLERAEILADA